MVSLATLLTSVSTNRHHAGPSNGAMDQYWQTGGDAPPTGSTNAAARNLGWFSLGLGLAQVAAPGAMARLVGLPADGTARGTMRLLGVREIGTGVGLLVQAKPTPWLWARVGGDAMDLTLLLRALWSPETDRTRALLAAASVAGVAAVDVMTGLRMAGEPAEPYEARHDRPVHVRAAVTINAPITEVFQYWDGFQRLPEFIQDAATVEATGAGTSRWTVAAPAGASLTWDLAITETRDIERISWQTGESSPISAAGDVRFRAAPGGRGAEVVFDARFDPPGGDLGKSIGGALALTMSTKLGNDLRRLKQLIELGEVVRSDDSIVPGPNPAQPPATVPPEVSASLNAA